MRHHWILSILLSLVGLVALTGCPSPNGGGDDDDNDVNPGTPAIASLSPTTAPVAATIHIVGTDFGDATGTVTFGSQQATIISWATGAIDFAVPDEYPGSYDVKVTNAGGTSNAVAFGVILPPAVYVNNTPFNQASSVAAWSVDANGTLTPMSGSPYATGTTGGGYGSDDGSIKVHEATRRLFVGGKDAIAVFDINPATGALTAVAGSPFSGNTGGLLVYGVAVTADGSLLYGACPRQAGIQNTSFILIFEVQSDGSLVEHATSPLDTGVGSRADVAMLTPDDKFLYVNTEDGEFLGYSVATDGTLSIVPGSPFLVDAMAKVFSGRVHPDGRALYLPETALNNEGVLVYSLNRTTGVPTLDPDSPHAALNASGVAFANDGNRLYAATFNGNTVYGFDVAVDGDLTELGTSPYTLNTSSSAGIAVSADGTTFVVVDQDADQIGVYDVGGDGTLTEKSGSPYANGTTTNGTGVAITF